MAQRALNQLFLEHASNAAEYQRLLTHPLLCDIPILDRLVSLTWTLRNEGMGKNHLRFLMARIRADGGNAEHGPHPQLCKIAARGLLEIEWPRLPEELDDFSKYYCPLLEFVKLGNAHVQETLDLARRHLEGIEKKLPSKALAAAVLR